MNVRRMEAESIRDSILRINAKINEKLYGPPVPVTPDDYGQIIIGTDTRDGAGRFTGKKVDLKGEEFRRSIYIQVRRSTPLAVFESFDAPILNPNCEHRNFSTSPTQSLLMLNSQFIQDHAEYLAMKLQKQRLWVSKNRLNLPGFLYIPKRPLKKRLMYLWYSSRNKPITSQRIRKKTTVNRNYNH